MRIIVLFFHVSGFSNSSQEEPEHGAYNNSFPNTLSDIIPHLLVQQMNFLNSSNTIQFSWGISNCPYS